MIVTGLFGKTKSFLNVECREYGNFNIYIDLQVIITENRHKSIHFVNGMVATVKYIRNKNIIVKTSLNHLLTIYPITDKDGVIFYPIKPNYASTIYKVQGQTLPHVTVWFDTNFVGPGTAYVACSRTAYISQLLFLQKPKPCHFIPVSK